MLYFEPYRGMGKNDHIECSTANISSRWWQLPVNRAGSWFLY